MARVAITGATGLLGGNLAAILCEQGHEVVCTRRASSKTGHLDELPLGWGEADLGDEARLARCFEGAEAVFHCAAAVAMWRKAPQWMVEANVHGTERVIRACRAAGVSRLVHCSSVVAAAISTDGQPVDERHPWNFLELGYDDAYAITKRVSEERALEAARRGDLDVVVVQPGYMFGPLDARPSSGEMILQVIAGRALLDPPGVNSFVDVRDVARGMIAAWQKGTCGARYIMAGHNMPYRDCFDLIAEVANTTRRSVALPRMLAKLAGRAGDLAQGLTGREMPINSVTVSYALCEDYIFSSERARQELGYEIGPLEPAIEDAIDWFRAHDML